jgi:predicted acylesterase/phospholipase RssA
MSLHPKLADIGLSEFHRASEAIDRGYQEASAKLGEITRMQDSTLSRWPDQRRCDLQAACRLKMVAKPQLAI